MSSVRFVFPKHRLAELLATPGGLPVVEALQRAQANLETIRPTCRAELLALLELAEASYEQLGATFDDAGMVELYTLAVRGIGAGSVCGTPAVDEALTSLCDLLDHLRTQQLYDRNAIGVNVRAWRLLATMDLPKEGAESVLQGLRKVSLRYAERPQASAP
jgi:hypothetical protein